MSASLEAADLTHGFRTAFDVLTALTLIGVVIAVRFVAPAARPVTAVLSTQTETIEALKEAA